MKNIFFILSLSFLLLSCKKNISLEEYGTVKDFTGLDGCGLLIVLDKGEKLEPISLPSGITLVDGKRVKVKYKIRNDKASACMAGYIVEIVSLRYL